MPVVYFAVLLMAKDYFFLGSLFSSETEVSFMLIIFPLVLYLIRASLFNFCGSFEKYLYQTIFLLVIFSLTLCFTSRSSFCFLIFLENCVIFILLFIFSFSKDSDKISSAFFIFFINIFPSILFMAFCVEWGSPIFLSSFLSSYSLRFFSLVCFLGLLLSKLPLFLLHFWLTKAHVRASGCGSMILASLMLKIGTMGLYKFYHVFPLIFRKVSSFSFFFVSWSMFLLLTIIVRFFDLKYLVACSSIVHMAPIYPLCLWGEASSIFSSLLMMVGHGLVSYYIFFIVTLIYEQSYHRSIDFNKRIGSSSKLIFLFLFMFFLMNLGFPPFCNFISELLFLHSFYLFDYISFGGFCGTLVLRGIAFFFVISKALFGKKNFIRARSEGVINYPINYFYLFFFLLTPFLLPYFSSLFKTSFCGNEK